MWFDDGIHSSAMRYARRASSLLFWSGRAVDDAVGYKNIVERRGKLEKIGEW